MKFKEYLLNKYNELKKEQSRYYDMLEKQNHYGLSEDYITSQITELRHIIWFLEGIMNRYVESEYENNRFIK